MGRFYIPEVHTSLLHVSALNRCSCEHVRWRFAVSNEVSIFLVH